MSRKLRVNNLCCNIFVVFLKCTLEKGLSGFQQNDDDLVQGLEQEGHGQNEEEAQNPEEDDEMQNQEEAEEVHAQHEEEVNEPQEFHLEPQLQINFAEQSKVDEYNELPPEKQNEEQERKNTTVRRSNRAIKNQNG